MWILFVQSNWMTLGVRLFAIHDLGFRETKDGLRIAFNTVLRQVLNLYPHRQNKTPKVGLWGLFKWLL
jgi:hypothetical protein